ncbi:hypothetical protein [Truepera radiovictrix]|uniref:Glycoamylase-like domain-containing protein n=1 Tax=Truepera radiovictrix (strain DSM 17093 / CIP 108686 / LMG 22925 / RQ-24) TaxID=649638 RepID=D7CW11_TRURR|nr:hypothetical protein [Truepera radiovictrix]ADI14274.1 hypothetical protein Trad_1149 [Truepera radiovictrix DSM 17093]WMT57168.1 hypothetical protein RCV51_14260 [Truepera radiovictrix]
MKFLLGCLLATFLTSCTLPAVGAQAVTLEPLPLEPVPTFSLRGDPNFSPEHLPREMRLWHSRFWNGIEYVNTTDRFYNPETLASSGDLFQLGRHFNVYVTSLLTVLRVTGDLAILDEVDRLMQLAAGELRDYNADGFRNWRYLTLTGADSAAFIGDDYHEMDEILTHSMVAAVAYAFKANADFDARYAERAAFWTDYLQNDFEAKWRRRNDVPRGFPFLSRDLMHPYVQWIRFHYYMYGLTGDASYYAEAERMARQVPLQVREVATPGGPAYVWNQRFLPEARGDVLSCQPFVYLQLTFQAFQDLAMEGFSVFDDAFMQRVATSMTELVVRDGYRSFAGDICGGQYQAGLRPTRSRSTRGVAFHFVNFPYATIGKWDPTGRLETLVRRAYDELELTSENNYAAGQMNLSAAMLFLLAEGEEQQASGSAPDAP